MPTNAAEATQLGVMAISLLAALGGLWTAWLNRRSSAETTDEQARQHDIRLIIDELRKTVARQGEELKAVKVENAECLADRDQMRGELRRLLGIDREKTDEITELRARVARLEREGC